MRERQEGVVDSGRSVREDTKRKKGVFVASTAAFVLGFWAWDRGGARDVAKHEV